MSETDSLKAPRGKFRLVSLDQYDHTYFTHGDFHSFKKAAAVAKKKASVPKWQPTSFSDIYRIYEYQGKLLAEVTYDCLQSKDATSA